MLLYIIFSRIAEIVLGFVILFQFLLKLFTGKTSTHLDRFGRQLAAYFAETARFETFNTETVPFPFAPWPAPDGPPASETTVPARAGTATTKSRSGGGKRAGGTRSRKKPAAEAPESPAAPEPEEPGAEKPSDDTN